MNTGSATEYQCVQCREWYAPVFFEQNLAVGNLSYLKKRCIGCRLTARTDAKEGDKRWLVKARKAFHTHATKFARAGIIQSADELTNRFGWRISQIAHDMVHAFANGCPYCYQLFGAMPNGPRDLELDIVDRAKPPDYRTNVRYCCATCNRQKARTPAHLWGLKQTMWDRWRARQLKLADNPLIGTLFDLD